VAERAADGERAAGGTAPGHEGALAQRFPGVKFVGYKTFGSTHGAEEHEVLAKLPARMRELGVDAIISGMAC
jgi:hypothetical protein